MLKKALNMTAREEYYRKFDLEVFLKQFYTDIHPIEELTLLKLQDIFTDGTLKGPIKRCIDIGCGPTVHRLSAASKVCDTLVYSDYCPDNIKFVQDWLKDAECGLALQNMFKLCAKLEGFTDIEKGATEIQNRIKSKCSAVVPINIMKPQPLGQLNFEPFDVAFSAACLEIACDSYESYVAAVKNVATLVRPGGYLIFKGYFGSTFYRVNEVDIPVYRQSEENLMKGLAEGGLKVLDMHVLDHAAIYQPAPYIDNSNTTGSYFVLTKKPYILG